MLRRLRISLTVLYTLTLVAFMTVLIAITYGLLAYYFQSITDLALRHKMAHEFQSLGLALPTELEYADSEWNQVRKQIWPQARFNAKPVALAEVQENWRRQLAHLNFHLSDQSLEETYDSEMAAVFLIPLDAAGRMLGMEMGLNKVAQAHLPEQNAVQTARQQGHDLRTIKLADGTRVRLLTYQLSLPEDGAFFQLGRLLTDQDFILQRFLNGLLTVGVIGSLLSVVGSWWLAGRSLRPVEESIERQTRFVANASHELRTPLTLIRASTEFIQKAPLDDSENALLLQDIIGEVDHMARLVNDLLLLSQVDAKQLILKRRRVMLEEALTVVQRQFARVAQERQIRVELGSVAGVVIADPTRLHEILLILLDNAIYYTPANGVVTIASGAKEAQTWITISDTGKGIPPEHLPYVFDRFYQVEAARNQARVGLGLPIAQALVTAHGGTIQIESQLNVGTKVTVTLPDKARF